MSKDILTILDSQASKYKFMKGLLCLAKADGNISEEEKVFFQETSKSLGMNAETMEEFINILGESEINSEDVIFNARKQAIFFIRESIQLCYIDSKYDIKEKKLVEKIAGKNNIDINHVNKIEDWVKKTIVLAEEGNKLLEEA